MSLTIHPDPQEPAGGYAFLELPGGSLPDGPVSVAVFEAFGERYLSPTGTSVDDPSNWQTTQHAFGPYEVHRHEGADWVRIGPEIVNRIEEYTPLRITVDGRDYDISWPDTVRPRAGAALLGGIQTVETASDVPDGPALVGRSSPPASPSETAPEDPEPQVETRSEPVETLPEPAPAQTGEPEENPRRWGVLILLGILLLAAVLAAMWYLSRDEGGESADPTPIVQPDPLAEGDRPTGMDCNFAALIALGGFSAQLEAVRTCGREVSADTALRLIEDAAAGNDPDALYLFGTLYDGEVLDARIENLVGVTFDDDPARAAEYYSRAVDAGSGQASDTLSAVCERLSGSASTLEKGAHDDFCR